MRRETAQRVKVKVLNRKSVANQTGPESCVAHREVRDEALTGEPAGQPSSRESVKLVQGADAVNVAESNTDRRDSASACSTLRGPRPWHVGTLFAREPGDLLLDRPRIAEWSASGRRGVEADEERAGEVRPLRSSDGHPVTPRTSSRSATVFKAIRSGCRPVGGSSRPASWSLNAPPPGISR